MADNPTLTHSEAQSLISQSASALIKGANLTPAYAEQLKPYINIGGTNVDLYGNKNRFVASTGFQGPTDVTSNVLSNTGAFTSGNVISKSADRSEQAQIIYNYNATHQDSPVALPGTNIIPGLSTSTSRSNTTYTPAFTSTKNWVGPQGQTAPAGSTIIPGIDGSFKILLPGTTQKTTTSPTVTPVANLTSNVQNIINQSSGGGSSGGGSSSSYRPTTSSSGTTYTNPKTGSTVTRGEGSLFSGKGFNRRILPNSGEILNHSTKGLNAFLGGNKLKDKMKLWR